jgi:hypothetical protein
LKTAKVRSLDIFTLLDQVDRKNYSIWDSLTDEQKKEFSPLVTLRWMAGCTDPVQLIFLNEIVNPTVFNMGEHKEFLLKLLTVCSNGKPKRYQWINYKLGGSKKMKKSVELVMNHYRLSPKEAEDTRRLFSDEEILELAEAQGLQKDEIKELLGELRK